MSDIEVGSESSSNFLKCSDCGISNHKGTINGAHIKHFGKCNTCFFLSKTGLLDAALGVDDTPAQAFGKLKHETGKTCVCLGCKTVIPLNSPEFQAINKGAKCSVCFPNAGKMRLIGIAGQARAGKDTLASHLLANLDDWSRSSFADPLKAMLSVIGVDCSDDAKAVIDECFGVTPRHMMQTLGTEWGRQTIDNDIWVKAFARLNAGKCVIVPDVRFENEADLVRANGVLIHLVGRGGIGGAHVSENPISFKEGDIVIDNSRDLAWLYAQVDSNAVLGDFISEVNK